MQDTQKKAPQLLTEFMESIEQAIGGSSQLIHAHRDPRWMAVRNTLSAVKEKCILLAVTR